MSEQDVQDARVGRTNVLFAILALGSVCGLLEVFFGGLLRQVGFAYRSGLLTGLGFGVIAFGLAIFKKPSMAIWIGLLTVLCKQLVVPILHVSVMCKFNSCAAVLLEYCALSGFTAIAMSKIRENTGMRLLIGGAAAFVSSIAFYFIGMRLAPCPYLLSFNGLGGFGAFLAKESLNWAAFSAVLFPLGWLAGEKFADRISVLLIRRPRYFYAGAASTTIFCWVACAIAIAQGF